MLILRPLTEFNIGYKHGPDPCDMAFADNPLCEGDLFTEVLGKGIDMRKCLKNLGA